MTSNNTSTLRRNRFKLLIFSKADRAAIVEQFFAELEPYLKAWRAQEISNLCITGVYWTLLISHLRPRDYKVGPTPWADEFKSDELAHTPLKFRLRSCPISTQRIFYKWAQDKVQLEVTEKMPSSFEVLDLQCEQKRLITLITDPELFLSEIEGRDPFSFLLHDLVHADKFFADETATVAQTEYYIQLRRRIADGEFADYLDQKEFFKKLEYLMADMNSHPAHMAAYLQHIVLEAKSLSGVVHSP